MTTKIYQVIVTTVCLKKRKVKKRSPKGPVHPNLKKGFDVKIKLKVNKITTNYTPL